MDIRSKLEPRGGAGSKSESATSMTRRSALGVAGAAAVTAPSAAASMTPRAEDVTPASKANRAEDPAQIRVPVTHKRITTNGVNLHYVVAGQGPTVLCMHGWPQNHREFLPIIERLGDRYSFVAPDLRGYADSDKPYDGYEPKSIAEDMLGLLEAEH